MLDWMDKTHKTVYLLSKSLRLWPSQRLQLAMVITTWQVDAVVISGVGHTRLTQTEMTHNHMKMHDVRVKLLSFQSMYHTKISNICN